MQIFLNRHSELRSGWRMLLFVIVSTGIGVILIVPSWSLIGTYDVVGLVFVTASVLLGTYAMTRFINRKPFAAIGLYFHPTALREFGLGCFLGFLMMTTIFVVEYLLGFIGFAWQGMSLPSSLALLGSSLALFSLAAFFEEVLFRGYLFQTLIQAVTLLPAILLMALVFGLAHGRNPHAGIFSMLNVGLAGVWLSVAYIKTRSLWLPFGLHLAWNLSQTTLYSFPTSGIAFEERKLFLLTQSGPDWVTGGAFGPEGGSLATISLMMCMWYILKSPRIAPPVGIVTLDSVEDLMPQRFSEAEG